jgi:hypothetical protein
MLAFIKRHEKWFDLIVFGSSGVLMFVYTPFPVLQSLAQSPFFYFLGPAAGPAANFVISSIGGGCGLVAVKTAIASASYIHDRHQSRDVHPQVLPADNELHHNIGSFFVSSSVLGQIADTEKVNQHSPH